MITRIKTIGINTNYFTMQVIIPYGLFNSSIFIISFTFVLK
jgi:hypothetical protein